MAAADGDAMLHRTGHVFFGTSRRFVQRFAAGKPRRDRRGEGAARAVGVRHVEAGRAKHRFTVRVHEQIDGFRSRADGRL